MSLTLNSNAYGLMILAVRFLVFHGGSGSSKDEIKTAVNSGVIKMNVDTGKF